MTPHRPTDADPSSSRLLAKLPVDEYRRIRPLLEPVELVPDQVLYETDGPIRHAYFPTGGVLSALTIMQDGGAIEVATVGREGLVGHYGFGGKTSPHRMIAQIGGRAFRMDSQALADQALRLGPLRNLLNAYQVAFMAQVSQSVACNGLHRLEQRCC